MPSVFAATPATLPGDGADGQQAKPPRGSQPPVAPVPPAFDVWFERAASRDPALRFQSAGEMTEALFAILSPGGAGESAIPTLTSVLPRAEPPPAPPAQPSQPAALPTGRNVAWSTGRNEVAAPPRAPRPPCSWLR